MTDKPPMELAMNLDPKHAGKFLPGYAQIKYDGVPITFTRKGEFITAMSRQNEPMLSVGHIAGYLSQVLVVENASVTMECLVPGKPFKDASGIIRRETPDADTARIVGVIFDASLNANPKETYYIRMKQLQNVVDTLASVVRTAGKALPFAVVKSVKVETLEQIETVWAGWHAANKNIEGMMIHALSKPFQAGKRCRGMCRYKPQPTIDLEVTHFEEATSEAGEPLGMVGRVNVRLRRSWPQGAPAATKKSDLFWCRHADAVWSTVVGVGPGKLTHEERTKLWQDCQRIQDTDSSAKIGVPSSTVYAEIKYMPDETYAALRQPTVQRLRTDKTEGDVLVYS